MGDQKGSPSEASEEREKCAMPLTEGKEYVQGDGSVHRRGTRKIGISAQTTCQSEIDRRKTGNGHVKGSRNVTWGTPNPKENKGLGKEPERL